MTAAAGDVLPSRTVTITRERITAYAEASGDRNPIHLDDDFAKSVGLPGVIAHGMLSMGLLASFVSDWAGSPDRVRGLRCRFAGMVRPDDDVTFGGRVESVEEGVAVLELWAENTAGDRVLTKARASVLMGDAG